MTPGPDHLAHLTQEAAALSAVLRHAPADAAVPDCPGWTLADLTRHVGAVHRWAAALVTAGAPVPAAALTPAGLPAPMTRPRLERPDVDDEHLAPWFDQGARELLAVLTGADPDQPCWTLAGAGTAAFWRRRMALETAVHRVDAQRVLGPAGPIAADLAADGVAEIVEVMLPRQLTGGRLAAAAPGATLVAQPDGPQWQLGQPPSSATVTGPAEVLFLLLWRRAARTDPRLVCHGDLAGLDALLSLPLTP